mmetsp:Transcript_11090/g.46262  ORF Transcript_11090/g.46262 Transcript_11090/m.46262 type:complete len:616 (+) Transcript_11090:1334-3181(+)
MHESIVRRLSVRLFARLSVSLRLSPSFSSSTPGGAPEEPEADDLAGVLDGSGQRLPPEHGARRERLRERAEGILERRRAHAKGRERAKGGVKNQPADGTNLTAHQSHEIRPPGARRRRAHVPAPHAQPQVPVAAQRVHRAPTELPASAAEHRQQHKRGRALVVGHHVVLEELPPDEQEQKPAPRRPDEGAGHAPRVVQRAGPAAHDGPRRARETGTRGPRTHANDRVQRGHRPAPTPRERRAQHHDQSGVEGVRQRRAGLPERLLRLGLARGDVLALKARFRDGVRLRVQFVRLVRRVQVQSLRLQRPRGEVQSLLRDVVGPLRREHLAHANRHVQHPQLLVVRRRGGAHDGSHGAPRGSAHAGKREAPGRSLGRRRDGPDDPVVFVFVVGVGIPLGRSLPFVTVVVTVLLVVLFFGVVAILFLSPAAAVAGVVVVVGGRVLRGARGHRLPRLRQSLEPAPVRRGGGLVLDDLLVRSRRPAIHLRLPPRRAHVLVVGRRRRRAPRRIGRGTVSGTVSGNGRCLDDDGRGRRRRAPRFAGAVAGLGVCSRFANNLLFRRRRRRRRSPRMSRAGRDADRQRRDAAAAPRPRAPLWTRSGPRARPRASIASPRAPRRP